MRDIRVAKPYARALYEAAIEQNALELSPMMLKRFKN